MKKTKQVLAIIAIVLLLGMYVAAFVLAFMKSEHAQILFRAALGATILVPVLLYLVLMVARMLKPAKSAVIDAIIFDLGLVLIDWPWEEHAASVGISEEAIRGQSRQKNTATARQVAMYLCRTLTNMALTDIGHQFEDRNHATVLSSVRKIEDMMKTSPDMSGTIRDITSNINSKN